jgi:hypothetical protein
VYFSEEPQVLKNKIRGVLVGGLLVPLMIIPSFLVTFFSKNIFVIKNLSSDSSSTPKKKTQFQVPSLRK